MPFPQFDGENPHLWKDLCEQYFAIYGIQESFWVQMATLNFSPTTAVWLQSVRKKVLGLNWEGLCAILYTRFGRHRHQLLIRQFYAIRQSSTVQEYIDRFEHLMNQLLSYSDEIHPFYFLTRFIGGLRADLRAAVMVQRPPDLDMACSLALVQEEVHGGTRPEYARVHEQTSRPPPKVQLQAVPLHQPRPALTPAATDHRGVDAARTTITESARPAVTETNPLRTLCAYRRARGLCFKCGERWGRDHTFPATIQMHVLGEWMDFMGVTVDDSDAVPVQSATSKEVVMAISIQAFNGNDGATLLQLMANVKGKMVSILIDSGSSTFFINERLIDGLPGVRPLGKTARVKVANGAELYCSQELVDCDWVSQGHQFSTTLKYYHWEVLTLFWEWIGLKSTILSLTGY